MNRRRTNWILVYPLKVINKRVYDKALLLIGTFSISIYYQVWEKFRGFRYAYVRTYGIPTGKQAGRHCWLCGTSYYYSARPFLLLLLCQEVNFSASLPGIVVGQRRREVKEDDDGWDGLTDCVKTDDHPSTVKRSGKQQPSVCLSLCVKIQAELCRL